jgi:preprotein translocase subunit YajC
MPPILAPLCALIFQDAAPQSAPTGAAEPPMGGLFGGIWVPMIAMFVVFYFMILRPESKARKARAAMLATLQKGDRVVLTGGMHGTVIQVQEGIATIQIDDGVRPRFSISAIQSVERDADKTGDEKVSGKK